MPTTFDLDRFVSAQAPVYETVLAELRAGRKRTHWMWFIFPQIAGLGRSATARLRACCALLLAQPGGDAHAVFGDPDDIKLRSSLTLFAHAAPSEAVFQDCLAKYFGGRADAATLERLS